MSDKSTRHWSIAHECEGVLRRFPVLHWADEPEEGAGPRDAFECDACGDRWVFQAEEDLVRRIKAIAHPCHDVCIGNLHADCQCAAWIRQEAISVIDPRGRRILAIEAEARATVGAVEALAEAIGKVDSVTGGDAWTHTVGTAGVQHEPEHGL